VKTIRILLLIMSSLLLFKFGPAWAQSLPSETSAPYETGGGTAGQPSDDRAALANDDDPPVPEDAPPPGGPDADRHQRHFEEFRMMKMIELLDLKDQQETPFMTAYQDMRKQQRNLDDRKRDLLQKLSRAIRDSKSSSATLSDLVDQVVKVEVQKRELNRQFLEKARTILTPVQTAKLVLFAERFDSTVSERLRALRQRTGQPGMHRGGMHLQADSSAHDSM
jgi:Spy/CpxP family protein refolding chaperone